MFKDGWIAVVHLDPYRVEWLSPTGRKMGPALVAANTALSTRDKCFAIAQFIGDQEDCQHEAFKDWPATLPPFLPRPTGNITSTLFADSHGRLVVARTPSVDIARKRYDVIDRDGRLAGVLELPLNESIIGFGEDAIFVLSADADGLKAIRRHPWR